MTDYPADILALAQSITTRISNRMEASSTLGDAATEVIAEGLTQTVWVAVFDYGYDGYGEPEKVFASKDLAEAWKASCPRRLDAIEIFELPLIRSGEQP
jgi:hypothetical protein